MEDETQDTITKQKGEAKDQKKTSGVWTYFEIDSSENNKAICLTCKEKISRGRSKPTKFNTSNPRKHLMTHKDEYKRFVDDEKKREERTKKKGNGVELQQTTLESIVERYKSYSANHPRAKAVTNRVAEMMATDLQHFSIVSDVGFCHLLAEREPRYVLPSRRHFLEVVIPEMYVKVKRRVSELLNSANYSSLTTDIRSSTNCYHLLLKLTAHFIVDSSMEKKDVMLCAWQFDELHTHTHTAPNISVTILSHVRSWEIEER